MALNVIARGPIYPTQFLISYLQVWYQQWMDGSFGGFAFINHKCVHPFYSLIYIPNLLGLSSLCSCWGGDCIYIFVSADSLTTEQG